MKIEVDWEGVKSIVAAIVAFVVVFWLLGLVL
jgi:hypothetical protein